MDVGKRLRQLREIKGLSQGDIERRSGLLRSYISRVEGGYTAPSLATLEKFSKALEIEPYQLLFLGEGKPAAPKVPEQMNMGKPVKRLVKCFESDVDNESSITDFDGREARQALRAPEAVTACKGLGDRERFSLESRGGTVRPLIDSHREDTTAGTCANAGVYQVSPLRLADCGRRLRTPPLPPLAR